ncbi:AMP-binding protein [Xanthobacter sp. DSM 24535]|uniref:class I adenylate-forming enzyme family protein n=1 Tax=Roseixanthobacter psychrophilus TaxID=3119917 RepID=UPI0037271A36
MLIGDLLQEIRSDKAAIIFEGQTISYSALDELSNQFAHLFGSLRLEQGDRVSLLIGNEPFVVAAYFGMFKAGLIANPINNRLSAEDVAYIVGHAAPKLMITTPEYLPLAIETVQRLAEKPAILLLGTASVDGLPLPVLREARLFEQPRSRRMVEGLTETTPILLIYTSGTTGRPKGVLLSHANVWADSVALSQAFRLDESHVALCFMPLFHCNALIVSHLAGFVAHSTVLLCRKFSAREHWKLVADHGVRSFSAPPTVLAILLEREAEARAAGVKLDFVKTGSAPLTMELASRFERRFGQDLLIEGWGLTEGTATSTLNPLYAGGRRKIGSVGQALPGQEVAAFDDLGRKLGPDQVGELSIRSPTLMLGYYKDDAATEKALVNGWLRTGDLGRVDADGHVFLVGRKKEIIIRGGENISPLEVEEVICRHPAVRDVAVGGMPDRIWGEIVVACIVPSQDVSEEEILSYCRDNLADFKVPVRIAFAEDLPRNATGKILRRNLNALFQSEGSKT